MPTAAISMQQRLKSLKDRGILVIGRESRPAGAAMPASGEERHWFWDHDPLWNHVPPRCARPMGPDQEPPLFERLPAGASLPKALARTRLCLFAGAALTPELRLAMARPETPVLLFEPRLQRLCEFLAAVDDAQLLSGQVFLFCGDPAHFERPLAEYLGPNLFGLGYPAVFALTRVAARHEPWLAALARHVETLFFRHRIYPIEGQSLCRSLPLRPLVHGLSYDQIRHCYENIPLFFASGRIDDVKNAFLGATAVCVAAGPALDNQIGYVRQAQARGGLVIAVNNAVRTLAAHGIAPHFVVINDTSLAAGAAFAGLPPMDGPILVAHPLSATGAGVFSRRLFFANHLPQLFGTRLDLRLHGSVITTAVSLARHLGCAQCVLAGVQLASFDAHGLAYAKDSIHGASPARPPRTGAWPELYPVRAASGRQMYTSANYLDACLWFLDEVRTLGLRVVNITADSILYGPGVEVAPDFPIDPGREAGPAFAAIRIAPPPLDREAILGWLDAEQGFWENARRTAAGWLETGVAAGERLARAQAFVGHFDANGVSYGVQRYRDFDNEAFHRAFFAAKDPGTRLAGARTYFEAVRAMAGALGELAGQARRDVAAGPGGGEVEPLAAS